MISHHTTIDLPRCQVLVARRAEAGRRLRVSSKDNIRSSLAWRSKTGDEKWGYGGFLKWGIPNSWLVFMEHLNLKWMIFGFPPFQETAIWWFQELVNRCLFSRKLTVCYAEYGLFVRRFFSYDMLWQIAVLVDKRVGSNHAMDIHTSPKMGNEKTMFWPWH